jgi:hypothetical protein
LATRCAKFNRLVEFSRSAPHVYSVKVDMASPVSALQVVSETLKKLSESNWEEVVNLIDDVQVSNGQRVIV